MKFFVAKWRLGHVLALYTTKGLHTILLGANKTSLVQQVQQQFPTAQQVFEDDSTYYRMQRLIHYINTFEDADIGPLDLKGTCFQQAVWDVLSKIPVSQVMTYSQIAIAINQPKAYRAVANACGQNPIPPIIPCHRAVGVKNTTGYRFGATLKQALLKSEKR